MWRWIESGMIYVYVVVITTLDAWYEQLEKLEARLKDADNSP